MSLKDYLSASRSTTKYIGLVIRTSLGPPLRWTMSVYRTSDWDYSDYGSQCNTACNARQLKNSVGLGKLLV
jgi:hypothetical protein